jgi:NitT/TauT family transport system substrate-binding protein
MRGNTIALIKGGGDIASGIAHRSSKCRLKVVMAETARLLSVKRGVSLTKAVLVLGVFLSLFGPASPSEGREKNYHAASKGIGIAVEFTDHAACAYIARAKGWFREEGLTFSVYETYVTGSALASALARGDIQAAYICLVPAINVYANAKVPLKIVSGTHKYGYGLVVNPYKVNTVMDLQKPGINIGSVREGSATDVLLHRVIDAYGLDKGMILHRVKRMDPPKQILAIKMGHLDASFLPEQWASMAEDFGFAMLLTARDVCSEMQGSVLIVKQQLIRNDPDLIRRLIRVTQMATHWAVENPTEAALILAKQLSAIGKKTLSDKLGESAENLEISPQALFRSMARLEYTTSIDSSAVQKTINYLHRLGYIRHAFKAEEMLDMRFLR